MKPHHLAWLEAHPHRSAEWLQEHLRDGFDVHHIDGNKENNDPNNLVLIEHTDHMMLHGSRMLGRIRIGGGPKGMNAKTQSLGATLYHAKRHKPVTWKELSVQYGLSAVRARYCAETYAKANRLAWPLGAS